MRTATEQHLRDRLARTIKSLRKIERQADDNDDDAHYRIGGMQAQAEIGMWQGVGRSWPPFRKTDIRLPNALHEGRSCSGARRA